MDIPEQLSPLEQREAGGEAVEEVASSDRTDLAGTEAPGQWNRAQHLLHQPGVVVGAAEQVAAPPVAREQQGSVGVDTGKELAEILVGSAGVAHMELDGLTDRHGVAHGP